jgi:hypothetical protein
MDCEKGKGRTYKKKMHGCMYPRVGNSQEFLVIFKALISTSGSEQKNCTWRVHLDLSHIKAMSQFLHRS